MISWPSSILSSEFRMYYSASSIHLDDSNIEEPLHLGLARAGQPTGHRMARLQTTKATD